MGVCLQVVLPERLLCLNSFYSGLRDFRIASLMLELCSHTVVVSLDFTVMWEYQCVNLDCVNGRM